MNRIVYILLTVVSIFNWMCSKVHLDVQLLEIESQLNLANYDSAYILLNAIDQNNIESERQMAEYHFLKTKVLFKKFIPLGDSMINQSIEYYKKNPKGDRLAWAYHLKAGINYDLKRFDTVMLYYKLSEQESRYSDDHELLCRNAWGLCTLNMGFGDSKIGLSYSLRQLKESYYLSGAYKSSALLSVAYAYYANGMIDSSLYYAQLLKPNHEQLFPYMKKDYYTIMGLLYKNIKPDSAFWYFQESTKYGFKQSAYKEMAKLYYQSGDYEKTIGIIDQCYAKCCYEVQIEFLEMLADMDKENGKYSEALALSEKISILKDSLAQRHIDYNLAEMQKEMDLLEQEQVRKIRKYITLAIFVIVLLVMVAGYMYYHNNHKESRVRLIATQNKIKIIQNSITQYENETTKLKEEIENIKNPNREFVLQTGEALLKQVINNEPTILWNKSDFCSLMQYYKSLDPYFVKEQINLYENLNPKNFLLLLLIQLGKTEEEQCKILCIQPSSIRSKLSRLKSKATTGR